MNVLAMFEAIAHRKDATADQLRSMALAAAVLVKDARGPETLREDDYTLFESISRAFWTIPADQRDDWRKQMDTLNQRLLSSQRTLTELRRFMPENENVRVGDAVAAIRDLEQAKRAAMDNCETLTEMMRAIA